ncbi:hypothetical protein KKA33_04730 [Patescibacteria group bacterium]|nr:hypothetical protein [Patescibacteria group bacterium]
MAIVNTEEAQDPNRPLKRSMSGFEIESHIIDKRGNISYDGYKLYKKILKKFPDLTIEIEKECGKSMIELGCFPDINMYNPAINILETLKKINDYIKSKGYRLFPFATYPGKMKARFTPDKSGKYKIQEKIFGPKQFEYATKVVGFHYHYTLPKNVFDEDSKSLKFLKVSKLKRSMMNSYNFEIAIDPIFTVLTQSSPFFDCKNIAKDTRKLIYRGGKKLNYKGLYDKYQSLGGLPPYKQTLTDLLSSMKRRKARWEKLVKSADPKAKFDTMYPYGLDISWNPVKINKHGTLEYRGMSMNYLSIVFGLSALLKFCLRKIQREFIEVIPDDDISSSFSLENGILRIPAHTYVRNQLQKTSAYDGLANEELYEYVVKFYKFAKEITPKKYYPLLKRIEGIIDKRKTVSDEILDYAFRNKLMDRDRQISEKDANKIALYLADKFEADMQKTEKIIRAIMESHKNTN